MWDRAIIKSNAKAALRGHFWVALAVVFTASVISEALSIFYNWRSEEYSEQIRYSFQSYQGGVYHLWDTAWMAPFGLVALLLSIFVLIPLTIGMMRFFVQNRFGHTQYETVFSGFKYGYGNSVLTLFVTDLFIGLWSLLLIVPGIIKALQYSMVSFILSDNPNIDQSRARQISKAMTDGEKGNIFVLILSFIGWALIPAIVGGIFGYFNSLIGDMISSIGMIFLYPYIHATFTELYVFLRDRAIQSGMVHPAELGLMPPAQNPQDSQM